jgi:hypothetical protein
MEYLRLSCCGRRVQSSLHVFMHGVGVDVDGVSVRASSVHEASRALGIRRQYSLSPKIEVIFASREVGFFKTLTNYI